MSRRVDQPDFTFIPSQTLCAVQRATGIDPTPFFQTTGEAIQKLKQLRREARDLILSRPPPPPSWLIDPEINKEAFQQIDTLIEELIAIRGSHSFLECEWEGGLVRCRRVDTRGNAVQFQLTKAMRREQDRQARSLVASSR